MRKYDKRNKMMMLLVLILSVILIVIFSFFINKVITNGKIVYTIDAGSIMYDKDKNIVKIDEDATLKIKWNDMYYLMYKEQMHSLGKNAIIYNPQKSQMNLYGKYYEVTSSGEDKVIIHEDETLVNTNDSKFYKLADRKYLIIDNSIRTENNEVNTSNYLVVELDKQGNAQIYNNSINLKTFKETKIITSTYTFDIAEELLQIGNEEVDLKKIIGSTNEYVKAEDIESDKEQDILNNEKENEKLKEENEKLKEENEKLKEEQGNGTGDGDGNGVGNDNNTNEEPEDEKQEENGNGLTEEEKDNIIKATKTTSIVSVTSSVGYINVDYVIYDPLDEYEAVFAEVYDANNNLEFVSYFDKTTNNLVMTGLKANVSYNIKFKYSYYDENGERIEEEFDDAKVTMGSPELSLKISKVTSNKIYYTLYLDKDYELDSVNINLTSDDVKLTNAISNSELSKKESITGYFEYTKLGDYVTVYLSDVIYKGYKIDKNISYKIRMP